MSMFTDNDHRMNRDNMRTLYNKKKLKQLYRELDMIRLDLKPAEGYVTAIKKFGAGERLKECIEPYDEARDGPWQEKELEDARRKAEESRRHEKHRDVPDEVKKTHRFIHFMVASMGRSKNGKHVLVMFNSAGNINDSRIYERLLVKRRLWFIGETRLCCACIPEDSGVVGVSIRHPCDNHSKAEARWQACHDSLETGDKN